MTQGAVCSELRLSLIMDPRSAMGGFTSRPRKESPARFMIIAPISRAAVTTIGPKMLRKNMLKDHLIPTASAQFGRTDIHIVLFSVAKT